MAGREAGEDVEDGGPNEDKEDEDKDECLPGGEMLARPEVEPVSSVGGREPVVLYDDDDEEPDDDLPPEQRGVE